MNQTKQTVVLSFSILIVLLAALTVWSAPGSEFGSPTIHVGVVVTDLEESLEFYQDVIGMSRHGAFDIDPDFGRRSGLSGGSPFSVVVLQLQDSSEATQWKLMSFDKKPGHKRGEVIQDDTGMQYITILVKDLKPFIGRLKKHGIKMLGETPIQLGSGDHFVLIQDPDGTFIELIGPLAE